MNFFSQGSADSATCVPWPSKLGCQTCRATQHFTGTVSNEATSEIGISSLASWTYLHQVLTCCNMFQRSLRNAQVVQFGVSGSNSSVKRANAVTGL